MYKFTVSEIKYLSVNIYHCLFGSDFSSVVHKITYPAIKGYLNI